MRNRSHMEECRCAECSGPREQVFMPPEPVSQDMRLDGALLHRALEQVLGEVAYLHAFPSDGSTKLPPAPSGCQNPEHPMCPKAVVVDIPPMPSTASVAAAVRHVEGGGTQRLVLVLDEGPPGLHLYTAIRVRHVAVMAPPNSLPEGITEGLTATVVARAMSLAECQTAILALPPEGRQAGDAIVILQLLRAYKVGAFGDLAMEWSGGDMGGVPVLRNHLA